MQNPLRAIIHIIGFALITAGLVYVYSLRTTSEEGNGHEHDHVHAGEVHAGSPETPADGHEDHHEEPASSGSHGHDHDSPEAGDWCADHRLPETECGICQPQLAATLRPGESLKVRLPAADSTLKGEIRADLPRAGGLEREQEYPGELTFNEDRLSHVSSLVSGVIQAVHANLGSPVKPGQPLMEIISKEISNLKKDFLLARQQRELKETIYRREKTLMEKNISSRQEFQEAEAAFRQAETDVDIARQQLLNVGLTTSQIDEVAGTGSTSARFTVSAPIAGTVIQKHAAVGESVTAGEPVFQVADMGTFWLDVSIPESNIARVRLGDPVRAVFTAFPGREFAGPIIWISPSVNPETRMVAARARLANEAGLLKEGLFGRVRLPGEAVREGLVIPYEAVQTIDGREFVFIPLEDDLFALRHVRTGVRDGDLVHIAAGLDSGEPVVVAGSFTLKSEFLRSRFGAGCTHD
jgi:cobalt-zinc-cadmium efflux system membrane fusion protein